MLEVILALQFVAIVGLGAAVYHLAVSLEDMRVALLFLIERLGKI